MKQNKKYSRFLMVFGVSLLIIISISNSSLSPISTIINPMDPSTPLTQMNYIKDQLFLDPYVWDTMGYTGDSNASIAIIGSGIDASHSKFGLDPFGDMDFTKKIIGWKDFVNESNLLPTDPNGLSTFTAISAYGMNDTNSVVPLDGENRTTITLGGYYFQPEQFPYTPGPGQFEIKLGSFYVDQVNANITLNATCVEYDASYIQDGSFQIRSTGTTLNETTESIIGVYRQINYTGNSQPEIYDIYFNYNLGFSQPANFSVNAILNINLENEVDYSGIAPKTKLVALRVLDELLKGNVSTLISALNWTKNNRDDYHIVGVQVDLGEYNWDISVSELSDMIESLIENGIMIFLPSGDDGVIPDSLNSLVVNEYPIVIGSVNDVGKLTYYTSLGTELPSYHAKIDIVAPGGSYLASHRTILAGDTNEMMQMGISNQITNDTTTLVTSSISASLVAAAYNLLIEASGGYSTWELIRTKNTTLSMKSLLLMTATELNQARENDPITTEVDEDSNQFSPELNRGDKDQKEGFGILNIPAALETILYQLPVNNTLIGNLTSTLSDSIELHSTARKIQLLKNEYYNLNLTHSSSSDLDFYIYENRSDFFGDPVILYKSTTSGNDNESITFGLEQESGIYILVIKAVSGEMAEFNFSLSQLSNSHTPILTNHSANGIQGFNDTLDTFEFIINYTDVDDLPPIQLDLNVSGVSELIPLVKIDENDYNYTDGCLYSATYHFYTPGMYEYHIIAWDGIYSVRTPSISNYSVEIVSILSAEHNDYSSQFDSIENWQLDGAWNQITQMDIIDSRGMPGTNWNALYFGDNTTVLSGLYSYESISEASLSIAYSPQIWINESSDPLLQLGTRISMNLGDNFFIDIRSNRTGSWDTLDSFTGIEDEWDLLKYDLTAYRSTYIQIRFSIILDFFDDIELNKGVMIGNFDVVQNKAENLNPTMIFNTSVTPELGPKFQSYRFTSIIGDQDGLPPDLVYLEIDNVNRTMFNINGNFEGQFVVDNDILQSGGILYSYDLYFASITNSSFRIHTISNGDTICTEYLEGPIISNELDTMFPFYGVPSNMSVYGNPEPKPQTIWVSSSNSFHYISTDDVWYAGENYYQGYGENWDVYLITSLIHIPTSTVQNDRVYLWFEHQLILDSTFPEFFEDYATIKISSDYGQHWYELITYQENIDSYQLQKIDLFNYRGMDVLIRFEFHSDDTALIPVFQPGWYIRNIMVNVDETIDREPPTVIFTNIIPNMEVEEIFFLEITIIDPSGIDDELVVLYINTISIEEALSVDGTIFYALDTTQFRNGNTTISVLAYDTAGNQIIASISITINNKQSFAWVYVVAGVAATLLLAILYLYFRVFKPAQRKRELSTEHLTEEERRQLAHEQEQRELREMKIREEADMATPASEALKPFTYECKHCSKRFQNKEYSWSMVCPDCKTETLNLAYECKICNKIYYKDVPGEYFCKECNIKLLK